LKTVHKYTHTLHTSTAKRWLQRELRSKEAAFAMQTVQYEPVLSYAAQVVVDNIRATSTAHVLRSPSVRTER
jgi:hypothetical protein